MGGRGVAGSRGEASGGDDDVGDGQRERDQRGRDGTDAEEDRGSDPRKTRGTWWRWLL
jgi:hypothetical protein